MSEVLHQLGIDWRVILVQATGFLLVYLILRRFMFGPVGRMMQERRERIARDLEEAERVRQEAARVNAELAARLAEAHEEGRQMIQDAVREAQEARERLLAEAREEAHQFVERARSVVAYEREQALVELRQQVAELAVLAARHALHNTVDPQAQRQAIDQFIAQVEAMPPAPPHG